MTNIVFDFHIVDMHPLEAVVGSGLKALIQTALDISIINNRWLLINNLLAAPKTIHATIKGCAAEGQ